MENLSNDTQIEAKVGFHDRGLLELSINAPGLAKVALLGWIFVPLKEIV